MIHATVNSRTETYNAGLATSDMSAKWQGEGRQAAWERVEFHFHQDNTWSICHGLHAIIDNKAKDTAMINKDSAFDNELNKFRG